MTEIDRNEHDLEERLRKHYQQRYEPAPDSHIVWSRVQPELDKPEKYTSRFTQRTRWLVALINSFVARRQNISGRREEEDDFLSDVTKTDQVVAQNQRFPRNKPPLHRQISRSFEVAITVLVVIGLLLGWFTLNKWQSTQGNGPDLYTYASQPGESVYGLQWTPDGKQLMFITYTQATNNYRYLVWDARTGKTRQTLSIHLPSALIGTIILNSSDGRYALIRTNGATQQTWVLKLANVLTGQTQLIYQGVYQGQNASTVPSAAFSEDTKYVAFIGADERIYIWDIAAGKMLRITDALTNAGTDGAQWFTWSLDDKRILLENTVLTSEKPARLQVWSVQTGRKLLNIAATPTMALFFWPPTFGNLGGLSPDGTRILTYNKQTNVMVERDSNTLKVLQTFPVQVSKSGEGEVIGNPLWITNQTFFVQYRLAISIWNSNTGKLVSTISLKNYAQPGVTLGQVDGHIVIWEQGNTVEIWNIVTGAKVRTIAPAIHLDGGVSWSQDDKYLDLNGFNQHGQIYNALTGELIVNYQGGSASISPGGQYIATQTASALQNIVRILRVS